MANSDATFAPDETDRRVTEMLRRSAGQPASMDLGTGQNINPPLLSEDELKRRGYPISPWWEK